MRDAINRELDRGGQVFFVHNRVETIEAAAERVRRLVPRAKVAIGHGQMAEGMLERVMLDFDAGRFDVLVCTTIIESGLDIPNANTIVISPGRYASGWRSSTSCADGLADPTAARTPTSCTGAAQPLSAVARKRLHAIFSASDLGAGYQIALSDLEIRGAGNILGAEQHGFMAAVGFELYTRMLAEAVDVRRGRAVGAGAGAACGWTCPGSAYLPDDYIADAGAKLETYRRFAAIHAEADAERCAPSCATDSGRSRRRSRASSGRSRCAWPRRRRACPRCAPTTGRVTLKWPRFDRAGRVRGVDAWPASGPTLGSNQVRLPVAAGRDPVDVALRALTALAAAR